ncbi:Na(+)-translocating NADH-quinone reductase subunit A [Moraxella bovoculi]|uniref:Na(+)-translocating NADH-quinone reductase subunit A n=1 Tax=Moraxella bovoculi TaxID=386891 RepID=A0AAC8PXF1_9GAMM|nr:Na(+)-translocating NADH-quinone reductase subunit A [Moraxella bovoculi]AKG08262.1 Na(+)-translocating NADH-quinone reductase subunit A [Moraxella bovoculi]AKG09182.1 Na(+)-translocating NADH-quinone reductase subunit A [Moraxella bovoculi]AKG11017.1 Na(+)-translocating NADH-quinone reductase subunit A [Moraxella bovoculi]AKG13008.1 Na(+)-translocating NADH-quinone reductase subunit A [Moraxella bovoculi]
MITIKKGLDLPISGEPANEISEHTPTHVALIGYDYIGMRPTMSVKEGDTVAKGQVLFEDKKRAGVKYTTPVSGRIVSVNRGERRVFESIVIAANPSTADEVTFNAYAAADLASIDREAVKEQLVASGEWTAFRTRPFSRTPEINSVPSAIFVTATDTNPLAIDPARIINDSIDAFNDGLAVISTLSPKTYVCHGETAPAKATNVANDTVYEGFTGKHPAGNAGTHIHFLHPLGRGASVWTIGYQDVIAIGKLFTTGRIYTDRVISLAGPAVNNPRLIRTTRGADLAELTANELKGNDNRVISGSVLSGRTAAGNIAYLGRFHNQVSALAEGRERPALHFFTLGANRFSMLPIYISQFFGGKKYDFTTSTNGSPRAMVPIGSFEKVMPQDYLPTQLLRSLIVGDIIEAVELGALELDEEDLALCTFVSPGKYEFGDILRDNLTRIEQEG